MTPFVWMAVVLMVLGAVLLIAGIGAPGLYLNAAEVLQLVGEHQPPRP